jgi:hypothetical protein
LPVAGLFAVAGAWRAFGRGKLRQAALTGTVVVVSAADLLVLGWPLVPQVDLQRYPLRLEHPTLAPLQQDQDLFRVWRWSANAPFIYRPSLLLTAGIDDEYGNFSLAPLNAESVAPWIEVGGEFTPVLDFLNIKYVLTDRTNALPAARFELVAEADGLRVFRNRQWLPRFFVVPRARPLAAREDLIRANLREVVLLDELPAPTANMPAAPVTVRVEQYSGNRVRLRVTTPQGGWLVASETFYPGWIATVNGQPAKIYRANAAFRAVAVPAGDSAVEMRFRPWPVKWGGAVSLATLAGVLGWCALGRRRRPQTGSTATPTAAGSADTIP